MGDVDVLTERPVSDGSSHRLAVESFTLGYVRTAPSRSWRPSCWTHVDPGLSKQSPGPRRAYRLRELLNPPTESDYGQGKPSHQYDHEPDVQRSLPRTTPE